MKHTIESIAEALRGKPSATECTAMMQACEPLRVERRARLRDLTNIPGLPFADQPAGWRRATLNDEDGGEAERKRLALEISKLDALEAACADAHSAALDAEARRVIPQAVKKLPKIVKELRELLAAMTEKASEFNQEAAKVAEFERLETKSNPVPDDELAEILQIRNELWAPVLLNVPHDLQPDPESTRSIEYPKSWPLLFELRGIPGRQTTIITRRPPSTPMHLPDYVDPVVRVQTRRRAS